MSIALQYPVMRWAEQRFAPSVTLILGIGVMAFGLGMIAFADNIIVLLICVSLYSLGGLLSSPSQQTVAANLANNAALGSYFGVAGLAIAIGGGMGSFSGGTLYGLGEQWHFPATPWIVFAGIGTITTLALLRFFRGHNLLQKNDPTPQQ
jgi:DHA1 family multidrug resistance protein-like MFS transporter